MEVVAELVVQLREVTHAILDLVCVISVLLYGDNLLAFNVLAPSNPSNIIEFGNSTQCSEILCNSGKISNARMFGFLDSKFEFHQSLQFINFEIAQKYLRIIRCKHFRGEDRETI